MATTKDSASIGSKISTLAEDVDKELTCAICLSRYETPKVLPCLHTYCKGCLGDLLAKSREPNRVTCPQCKEEHKLPEDGVDGFRTYFTINNLLELLQVSKLVSRSASQTLHERSITLREKKGQAYIDVMQVTHCAGRLLANISYAGCNSC